jgi:hypothetical protein
MKRRTTLAALILLHAAAAALAAPPPGADPALGPWFCSLMRPDTGSPCCSEADCRMTEYRIEGNGLEVLIDERYGPGTEARWVPVPPQKIVRNAGNPTGSAVACWTPAMGILCFVLPPGV